MAPEPGDGWDEHWRAQIRWRALETTPAQRLAWLEDARRFALAAQEAARRRHAERKG